MGLTLTEAHKIALKYRDDIDSCEEYTHAFIFGSKNDIGLEGGRSPVVVLKKNGEAVKWAYYYGNAPDNDSFIRNVDLGSSDDKI